MTTAKKFQVLFILTLAISSAAMLSSAAEAKTKYRLTLAMYDPAQSANTQYQEKWAEKVKKATNGEVEIQIFPGGTLCSAPDTLDAVKTGMCDIGWVFTSFYPNQFQFIDVVTLPMMGIDSAELATNVLWSLYETEPVIKEELKNFQMLMLFTNTPNLIGTSQKPVKSLSDISGLKLRSPTGAATTMVKKWGANPIAMGPGDMYQSVQKGVIDGYVFEYAGIGNYAMNEVTKYYTEMNLYVGPFMLLMNKGRWDSIPAKIQQQILSVSGRQTSIGAAACFSEDAAKTRKKVIRGGGTVIKLTPEAYTQFKVAADKYNQEWVSTHKSADVDSQAFFNKTLQLIDKYKK